MAETKEKEQEKQEVVQDPVPLSADSVKGEVQSLAEMIKGLGYEVDEKYLRGEYDENFSTVVSDTLKEFKSIAGFGDDATPEQMRAAVAATVTKAQDTHVLGLFGPTHYDALQDFAAGEASDFANRDAVERKLRENGYNDHHIENIKGVVHFTDNVDHYLQQIVTVEQFDAQHKNDAETLQRLQQEKQKRDQDILDQQKKPDETKLSGLQDQMMRQVFAFMAKSFPDMLPMLDGLVRQFTGGQGLTDLLPEEWRDDPTFKEFIGERKADPEEDLRASFIKAFENADDPEAREQALLTSVKALSSLPFGDKERRENFKTATEEALKEATEGFDKANVEQHANIFADRFMAKMEELKAEHPDATFKQSDKPVIDPATVELLHGTGLDASQLQDLFERQNQAYENDILNGDHEPLIFTHNGETYVAGLEQESKIFTVMKADDNAREFLKTEYMDFIGSVGKKHGGENVDAYLDTAFEKARPLDTLKTDVDAAYAATLAENQVDRAALQGQAHLELTKQLENAFDGARAQRHKDQSGIEKIADGDHEGRKAALIEMRGARDEENILMRRRRAKEEPELRQDEVSPEEWRLTPLRDLMRPSGDWRSQYKTHAEAIEAAGLATKPTFFTGPNGKTYAFATQSEYNNERALTTDITAEIKKYQNLTAEEKAEYAANPAKMDTDFNNLSAIAKQYNGLPDAFAVAKIATTKGDLSTSFNTTYDANAPQMALTETRNLERGDLAEHFKVGEQGASIVEFAAAKFEITGQKQAEDKPENIIEHEFRKPLGMGMGLG
jgi:uncharacterized protein YnzC (UPF0291/DUF896 family)